MRNLNQTVSCMMAFGGHMEMGPILLGVFSNSRFILILPKIW